METTFLPNPVVKNTNNVSKGQADDGLQILLIRKTPKSHVTPDQKDFIFEYVTKNPEMITLNMTPQKEMYLWDKLVIELNNLEPKKPLNAWKNFWKRWLTIVTTRDESQLSITEIKLKQYIQTFTNSNKNIDGKKFLKYENDEQNFISNKIIKRENDEPMVNGINTVESDIDWRNIRLEQYSTVDDLNQCLSILEKKRYLLNLEIDNNDYRIVKYSKTIKILQQENICKREEIKEINNIKLQLIKKKNHLKEMQSSQYSYENLEQYGPCKKIKQEFIDQEEEGENF